jgi:hypothetical protein
VLLGDGDILNFTSTTYPSGGTLDAGRQQAFRMIRRTATVLIALGIGTAALSLEDPLAPLVAASASVVDVVASISNQAPQATAAAALRPADGDGPTRLATAAASEVVDRPPAEADVGVPNALLQQFVAWAQDQDQQDEQERLQAQAQPPQQLAARPVEPVEAAQEVATRAAPEITAPVRVAEQIQRVHAFRDARAELPSLRYGPNRDSHAHRALNHARPVENAQDLPANNDRPSLLQIFGWHG